MTRILITSALAAVQLFCGSVLSAATTSGKATSPDVRREATMQLMSSAREQRLRRCLPKVEDADVQKMLDDRRLLLYTDREMPKAYQFWDGMMNGVHSASYNISANGGEPFGNGNREFPWGAPAGTHRTKNVWSFRFIYLPQDDQGKTFPIVWYRTRLKGDNRQGYGWRFPVGAVVGEVLMMRGHDGQDYCFELRTRTREQNDWAVNVFRPFPKSEDLVARIKELRPDWEEREAVIEFVTLLSSSVRLPERRLRDDHPRRTFDEKMGVYTLPSLEDDELVRELLTKTKFRSALGEFFFHDSNSVLAAAPTTREKFHVVPANYDAGFISVDRASCMRCHETVNQNVDRFEPARDWYGRIRGSDGIFSFHPFDPSCISGNGFGQPVRMREALVSARVIELYDPARHDKLRYARVPRLIE